MSYIIYLNRNDLTNRFGRIKFRLTKDRMDYEESLEKGRRLDERKESFSRREKFVSSNSSSSNRSFFLFFLSVVKRKERSRSREREREIAKSSS